MKKKIHSRFGIAAHFHAAIAQEKRNKGNYDLPTSITHRAKSKNGFFNQCQIRHGWKSQIAFRYEYEPAMGKNWILEILLRKTNILNFSTGQIGDGDQQNHQDVLRGQHLRIEDVNFWEDEKRHSFKVKGTEKFWKGDMGRRFKVQDKSAKDFDGE